jgi:hypothetical protein
MKNQGEQECQSANAKAQNLRPEKECEELRARLQKRKHEA